MRHESDHVKAHIGYQKVLQAQEKDAQLLEEYEGLLSERGEAWCYLLYSRLLRDHAKQEELLRKGLALEPDDPRLIASLASALWHQHELEEAIENLRLALRLDPESLSTYRHYIYLMEDAGKAEELVEEYEKQYAAQPDDFRTQLRYGVALAIANRLTEAQEHLDEAFRKAPDDYGESAQIHWNLAFLYNEKGNRALAIDHLKKFCTIEENPEALQKAQRAIEALSQEQ